MAEETNGTRTPGSPPAGTVAAQPPGNKPPAPPAAAPPAVPVPPPRNRGGRPRKDGFAPGSTAAAEANKRNDLERHKAARTTAAQVAEPPPLPSTCPPSPDPQPPLAPGATPGASGALLAPGYPAEPVVPWEAGTLRPLFEQLIEGGEEARVEKRRVKATAAKLPDKIVKEIVADAHFPGAAKRAFVLSGPNATAKALNSFGISGKYSDAAIAMTALVAIVVHGKRSDAKLDELIAEFKKAQAKNPDGAIGVKP